ncbi:Seed dormancy control [Orobanche minor]
MLSIVITRGREMCRGAVIFRIQLLLPKKPSSVPNGCVYQSSPSGRGSTTPTTLTPGDGTTVPGFTRRHQPHTRWKWNRRHSCTDSSIRGLVNTSHGTFGASNRTYQEANKPDDKVLRRLAQNREAARESHLRKKAYIQQLENIKLRLLQLEQELDGARQ